MRLQRWDLTISADPPEADSILDISPQPARHHARVRVGTFFAESRQEQRQCAVHELVHLTQAELWWFVTSGTGQQALRPAGLDWVLERVVVELEQQADELARLIAPRMPLPPRW
jgi:hypothetical protein